MPGKSSCVRSTTPGMRAPSPSWARFLSHRLKRHASSSRLTVPKDPARTRFAPSPTGYLHLGSLRTALFNYLLAKKTGGKFLLRLEDTDKKRTVANAEQRLYEDLRWAGLEWDEGPEVGGRYGPYRQSDRTNIYSEHAQDLLRTPHAYRCFCSAERLNRLAQHRRELGLPTDYDRTCASLSAEESDERAHRGEQFVVRLRAPDAYPSFTDMVYGAVGRSSTGFNAGVTHKHGEVVYEDPVLLKSDGSPTYHLANVIDDHLMEITHVVRATEWLSSTPKHLALYDAFGWKAPCFAHVGLLTDESGHKLSKRNMDTELASFREAGVLREALTNFAALLGWSHRRKSDVMSLNEMADEFRMTFTKGNTAVTFEKLWFLQRAHAARAAREPGSDKFAELLDAAAAHAQSQIAVICQKDPGSVLIRDEQTVRQRMALLLTHDAQNYVSPAQFFERNRYFFVAVPSPSGQDTFVNPAPDVISADGLARLARPIIHFSGSAWLASSLDSAMRAACLSPGSTPGVDGKFKLETAEEKARYKALCKYLRWVLLAGADGPGVVATMIILGREQCLEQAKLRATDS